MKKMKKYILAGTFALALASCSDSFLEEKMVSSITQDYLNTEIGLDQLIVSSYNSVFLCCTLKVCICWKQVMIVL